MGGNRRMFLYAWMAVAAIITYKSIKNCQKLPWPPQFIAAGVAFGLLDIFALFDESLADIMAVGLVIAFIINPKENIVANCNHDGAATAQPATWQTLQQQAGGGGSSQ